jgi:hypothetical protein
MRGRESSVCASIKLATVLRQGEGAKVRHDKVAWP